MKSCVKKAWRSFIKFKPRKQKTTTICLLFLKVVVEITFLEFVQNAFRVRVCDRTATNSSFILRMKNEDNLRDTHTDGKHGDIYDCWMYA